MYLFRLGRLLLTTNNGKAVSHTMVVLQDRNVMLLLSVAMLLLGACQAPPRRAATGAGATTSTQSPTPQPTAQITLSGDPDKLPPGCRPADAAQFVQDFFEAYNSGEVSRLGQFFDEKLWIPQLRSVGWFSDDIRRKPDQMEADEGFFTGSSRALIVRYITARHAQQEVLTLKTLEAGGPDWGGRVSLIYSFSRRAADLPDVPGMTWVNEGKGTVSCPEKKIVVWSSGTYLQPEKAGSKMP